MLAYLALRTTVDGRAENKRSGLSGRVLFYSCFDQQEFIAKIPNINKDKVPDT